MQAVILAGGLGTRLRPLTFQTPKSMVKINGKPFLEYQLQYLKKHGFKDFLLCIGGMSEQFIEHFNDGKKFGLNIHYSIEKEPLGTGGGLKNAESKLMKKFLLVNGDTYLPLDYKKLLDYHKTNSNVNVVVAYENADKIAVNNIAVDSKGFVTDYSKTSSAGMNCVDAGVYVFNKSVLSLIPKAKKVSLEMEIFPKLMAKKELKGVITNQRFYDMGTPERLKKIEELLK